MVQPPIPPVSDASRKRSQVGQPTLIRPYALSGESLEREARQNGWCEVVDGLRLAILDPRSLGRCSIGEGGVVEVHGDQSENDTPQRLSKPGVSATTKGITSPG